MRRSYSHLIFPNISNLSLLINCNLFICLMFTKHHFSVSVCSPSLRPQLTSWARCAVRSRKPLSRWCDSSCTMAKSCLSSVPLPTQRSTAHSEFKHTSSALKRLYLTFLTCLPFLQGSQHHIPGKLTDVQMH